MTAVILRQIAATMVALVVVLLRKWLGVPEDVGQKLLECYDGLGKS